MSGKGKGGMRSQRDRYGETPITDAMAAEDAKLDKAFVVLQTFSRESPVHQKYIYNSEKEALEVIGLTEDTAAAAKKDEQAGSEFNGAWKLYEVDGETQQILEVLGDFKPEDVSLFGEGAAATKDGEGADEEGADEGAEGADEGEGGAAAMDAMFPQAPKPDVLGTWVYDGPGKSFSFPSFGDMKRHFDQAVDLANADKPAAEHAPHFDVKFQNSTEDSIADDVQESTPHYRFFPCRWLWGKPYFMN